jgi:hypothetical protein
MGIGQEGTIDGTFNSMRTILGQNNAEESPSPALGRGQQRLISGASIFIVSAIPWKGGGGWAIEPERHWRHF